MAGADLRAAFVASCFLGALPPVDFLAVCFVLAIFSLLIELSRRPPYDRPSSKPHIKCFTALKYFVDFFPFFYFLLFFSVLWL